jgi:CRISPR-associated protein Csb1
MSNAFDTWLSSDGPVALSILEPLEPVLGENAVFFPPTFAAPEGSDDKPDYVIDESSAGRVCLVDTVGSQANRLEPMFKRPDLAGLVPRVTIKINDTRSVNLLDAGHRAADAVVRFSELGKTLEQAFLDYRDKGSAERLAKIAPTSLVFGTWDSRAEATGAKIPRLVESVVRAYKVERLTHGAQYFAALEKEELAQMELDSLGQKALSAEGLSDSPAGRGPGGVVAGRIQRGAVLNLVALRALGAEGEEETKKLQRYVLGLALIAFLAPAELFLRQGCLLVASSSKPASKQIVWRNGQREPLTMTEAEALAFAKESAGVFGVGGDVQAVFDPKLVKGKVEAKAKRNKKEPKPAVAEG